MEQENPTAVPERKQDNNIPVILATEENESIEELEKSEVTQTEPNFLQSKTSFNNSLLIILITTLITGFFSFTLFDNAGNYRSGSTSGLHELIIFILIYSITYYIFIIALVYLIRNGKNFFFSTIGSSILTGMFFGSLFIACWGGFRMSGYIGILYALALPLYPLYAMFDNLFGILRLIF